MAWKDKFKGGLLGFIGFMLSPLSWWNDAFVNLPLAHAFGWLVSLVHQPAFEPAVIVGYWLTNVTGFVLMHKGIHGMLTPEEKLKWKPEIRKDLLISLAYTLALVVLMKLKLVKPYGEYF
jgi:hypothetical protein